MNDDAVTVERSGAARRIARVSTRRFASAVVEKRYSEQLHAAQDAFLRAKFDEAAKHAAAAAHVLPCPSIFALLSAICEGLGHFDRALDFRLLQAFLSRDAVLWQELLQEFLDKQLYYKAAVCLQRLSALENSDARRYRSLQIQLADLYAGLGEIRRASHVLSQLWIASQYRDFEVLSSLAAMYFQLGRWSALGALVQKSLAHGFRRTNAAAVAGGASGEDSGPVNDKRGAGSPAIDGRQRKRTRFQSEVMTMIDDEQGPLPCDDGDDVAQGRSPPAPHPNVPTASSVVSLHPSASVGGSGAGGAASAMSAAVQEGSLPMDPLLATHESAAGDWQHVVSNEFDFDTTDDNNASNNNNADLASTSASSRAGAVASDALPSNGGAVSSSSATALSRALDLIDVQSLRAKKNLLTLVNIQSELLNEQGMFAETLSLLRHTAATLGVELLDLPPDLLVRYGVAQAYTAGPQSGSSSSKVSGGSGMNNDGPRPTTGGTAEDVFLHLLHTCSIEEYGDALYDAAVTLEKVGSHETALAMFSTLKNYHDLQYRSVDAEDEATLAQLRAEEVSLALRGAETTSSSTACNASGIGGALGTTETAETHPNNSLLPRRPESNAAQLLADAEAARQLQESIRSIESSFAVRRTTRVALMFHRAMCLLALGHESDAVLELQSILTFSPNHVDTRLQLAKWYTSAFGENDSRAAEELLVPREGDDPHEVVQLSAHLLELLHKTKRWVEAIGVGIGFFQLLLMEGADGGAGGDDGDCMSVASGASKRSRGGSSSQRGGSRRYAVPSLTQTTSAIVPTSVVADVLSQYGQTASGVSSAASSSWFGPSASGSSAASVSGGFSKTFGLLNATHAIAASYRVSSSASSAAFVRRVGSMTSTVAGSAAATSVASGLTGRSQRGGGSEVFADTESTSGKDTSLLFSFHYKRKPRRDGRLSSTTDDVRIAHSGTAHPRRNMDMEARHQIAKQRLEEYRNKFLPSPSLSEPEVQDGSSKGKRAKGTSVGDLDDLAAFDGLEETENIDADAQHNTEDPQLQQRKKRVRFETAAGSDVAVAEPPETSEARDDATAALVAKDAPDDIEVVAQRAFQDPALAKLFVDCTAYFASSNSTAVANTTDRIREEAAAAAFAATNARRPPTPHEIVDLIGKSRVMALAGLVVDCYGALEKYTEGKEFANIILHRWRKLFKRRVKAMEFPLQMAILRNAMASGDSADATRIATELIFASHEGKGRDGEEQHAVQGELWWTLSQLEGRQVLPLCRRMVLAASSSKSNLNSAEAHAPLYALLGNTHMVRGSARHALNWYLLALAQRPDEPYLNFAVGLSYCVAASMRVTQSVEECVTAGMYYLNRYRECTLRLVDEEATTAAGFDYADDNLASHFVAAQNERGESRSTAAALPGQHSRERLCATTARWAVAVKQLEVLYNTARLFHFLELHYLAAPIYESILRDPWHRRSVDLLSSPTQKYREGRKRDVTAADSGSKSHTRSAEQKETEEVMLLQRRVHLVGQRATVNLYWIYHRVTGNSNLAVGMLPCVCLS